MDKLIVCPICLYNRDLIPLKSAKIINNHYSFYASPWAIRLGIEEPLIWAKTNSTAQPPRQNVANILLSGHNFLALGDFLYHRENLHRECHTFARINEILDHGLLDKNFFILTDRDFTRFDGKPFLSFDFENILLAKISALYLKCKIEGLTTNDTLDTLEANELSIEDGFMDELARLCIQIKTFTTKVNLQIVSTEIRKKVECAIILLDLFVSIYE